MRRDDWLADVLGIEVYAVTPEDAGSTDAPGLYYAKVPVDDVSSVARLTRDGFSVVDVNVTLARRRDELPPPSPDVVVAPLADGDAERVLDIAGSCFSFSRFHLDPQLSDEQAHSVKREWIRSYVRGVRGVELLVATVDGTPAGFLAVLDADGARVIDLVGVDRAVQRRGVGAALVRAFVDRHRDASELRVGTQIANVPSLALYARCGFDVVRSEYVLHKHGGS